MKEKANDSIHLSLIIPAFNEKTRIGKSLEQILGYLEAQPYASEVIVVDDGSQDGTADYVEEGFGKYPQIRVERRPNQGGKGAAIRQGMLSGKGTYLIFSDADLSVPIETLPAIFSDLENHCDVAIGSRQKPDSVIEVHQPLLRELLGRVFTKLSSLILALPISDFTCGFKGFRREVARDLFSRQQLHDWSFDSEILYLAKIRGYRIAEVPVRWRNDETTKVRLWKDILTSCLGLLRIRFNHLSGRYK